MTKVNLQPVLDMISTIQAFMDVYACCSYEETQKELIVEIKTKINQLDSLTKFIKANYEKELSLDALSPEERKFEEFLERNKNKEKKQL